MNSLSISPIQHEFIVYFAISLGIYYLFFELTFNQISISRTRYLSRENKIKTLSVSQLHRIDYESTSYFANKLKKYFVFREFTNGFPFFFMNSLSCSRIHYIFHDSIYSLFHELTIYLANSISFSRIYFQLIIYFANSLSISRIQYLFREYTLN